MVVAGIKIMNFIFGERKNISVMAGLSLVYLRREKIGKPVR